MLFFRLAPILAIDEIEEIAAEDHTAVQVGLPRFEPA
jgi:hypothetical protein